MPTSGPATAARASTGADQTRNRPTPPGAATAERATIERARQSPTLKMVPSQNVHQSVPVAVPVQLLGGGDSTSGKSDGAGPGPLLSSGTITALEMEQAEDTAFLLPGFPEPKDDGYSQSSLAIGEELRNLTEPPEQQRKTQKQGSRSKIGAYLEKLETEMRALQSRHASLLSQLVTGAAKVKASGHRAINLQDTFEIERLKQEMVMQEKRTQHYAHAYGQPTTTGESSLDNGLTRARIHHALALNARDTTLHQLMSVAEELEGVNRISRVVRASAQAEGILQMHTNPDCRIPSESPWDEQPPEERPYAPNTIYCQWEGDRAPTSEGQAEPESFFLVGSSTYQSTAMTSAEDQTARMSAAQCALLWTVVLRGAP